MLAPLRAALDGSGIDGTVLAAAAEEARRPGYRLLSEFWGRGDLPKAQGLRTRRAWRPRTRILIEPTAPIRLRFPSEARGKCSWCL